MRILSACVSASALIACGDSSGADVILDIDPPPNGDASCVGVAGFEVNIVPANQAAQTVQRLGPGPILDATACAIPEPIRIQNLEIDSPVTVTVRGYDGTGAAWRVVTDSITIPNLRQTPIHLQLRAAATDLPPILVVHRSALLQGTPVSDLKSVVVTKQMQSADILSVDSKTAGVYMDPEPGAYGVAGGLLVNGLAVSVTLTTQDGLIFKDARQTVQWNGTYYETGPK